MGWKKTARSFGVPTTARGVIKKSLASSTSWEREAKRRQRELERQQKELARMQELERATYEVEVYENYIDVLSSIHKGCGDIWDWQKIKSSSPPAEPQSLKMHEQKAQKILDNYSPSFFDKTFKRVEKKRNKMLQNLEGAKKFDKAEYQKAMEEFKKDYEEWRTLNDMAKRVCEGDVETYPEVIKYVSPFEEISEYGSQIKFQYSNKDFIVADIKVREKDIIPNEIKNLLRSGKLSVKPMPQSKFQELYQDYVCGTVIRVARELFALLPIQMTIINATANLLNTKTGHMEDMTILSVAVSRKTLESLNLEAIDSSDSMENFVHKMDFKRGKGFNPTKRLNPSEFQYII